jgi:hypothetical protein
VDGANVVFVSVGDHNAAHLIPLAQQVVEIRDDVIDSQHIVVGEHNPGVDDQDIVAVFIGHHILAYFPQAPQRDDSQFFIRHSKKYTPIVGLVSAGGKSLFPGC